MNDSKDFQDAESVRSGNSHVTSRPVSFPPHPIPEGMLSRSFVTPRRKEGPPSIWDTHGISGNVFSNPHASSSAPYLKNWTLFGRKLWRNRSIHPEWRKLKGKNKIKVWDASLDRQPKIQSSSVEETLQRIMGQTNNDCRFRIFISAISLHQPRLLAGSVKRIPPDTAIHEQNGYAKAYNDNNLMMTIVDNDKSDTTYTDKHNTREVWARLHAGRCLSSLSHMYHTPHWLKVSWVCHPISTPCTCAVVLDSLRLLLLPLPALPRLFPVLPLHALRQLWLHDNQPAQLR